MYVCMYAKLSMHIYIYICMLSFAKGGTEAINQKVIKIGRCGEGDGDSCSVHSFSSECFIHPKIKLSPRVI